MGIENGNETSSSDHRVQLFGRGTAVHVQWNRPLQCRSASYLLILKLWCFGSVILVVLSVLSFACSCSLSLSSSVSVSCVLSENMDAVWTFVWVQQCIIQNLNRSTLTLSISGGSNKRYGCGLSSVIICRIYGTGCPELLYAEGMVQAVLSSYMQKEWYRLS